MLWCASVPAIDRKRTTAGDAGESSGIDTDNIESACVCFGVVTTLPPESPAPHTTALGGKQKEEKEEENEREDEK